MVCLDRHKPVFADYSSPTLSPMQLVAGCCAPTSAAATHFYPDYEPFSFTMKTEPSSPELASMMAYSTPSPSDSSSSWSQKPGDGHGNMSAAEGWPDDDGHFGLTAECLVSPNTEAKLESSYLEESTFSPNTKSQSDTSEVDSVADDDDEPPACRQRKNLNDDDSRDREALFTKHKDLIVQLYYKMRLEDVQLLMEAEYGLRATGRMYKQRLKAWGVEKNVTIGMVHRFLQSLFDGIRRALAHDKSRQLLTGPNTTLLLDIGYFDVVKIQKYIKRNSDGLRKMRDASDRSLDLIRSLVPEGGARGRNAVEPGRARLSMPTTRLVQILNLQMGHRARNLSTSMLSQPRSEMAQQLPPGVANASFQPGAVYSMGPSPAQVLQWPTHSSSHCYPSHTTMTLLGPSSTSPLDSLPWGEMAAAPMSAAPMTALPGSSAPLNPTSAIQMAYPSMWMAQASLEEQVMLGMAPNHDGSVLSPW